MIAPQEHFLGLSNDNPQGAQRFESTKNFTKERNNSVYFRLRKILCRFKDPARACRPGENTANYWLYPHYG